MTDGSSILYVACTNGLHAISGENGEELWTTPGTSYGCTTPCVDQSRGWVYYQNDGNFYKLEAATGKVLVQQAVPLPNVCSSFNTVLVNDATGYFVLTRWHTDATRNTPWDCGIRVYDRDLNLVWAKKDLPYGKKATIATHPDFGRDCRNSSFTLPPDCFERPSGGTARCGAPPSRRSRAPSPVAQAEWEW